MAQETLQREFCKDWKGLGKQCCERWFWGYDITAIFITAWLRLNLIGSVNNIPACMEEERVHEAPLPTQELLSGEG